LWKDQTAHVAADLKLPRTVQVHDFDIAIGMQIEDLGVDHRELLDRGVDRLRLRYRRVVKVAVAQTEAGHAGAEQLPRLQSFQTQPDSRQAAWSLR
jgi:hypothetical protein